MLLVLLHPTHTRHAHFLLVLVPQFCHTLTEIHLDAPVVHERIVHFEIGFRGRLFAGKFGKGVLQRSARFGIANDFHLDAFVKPTQNQFQIFVHCRWIEFANKQRVFRGANVRVGQVAEHFQNNGATLVFFGGQFFLFVTKFALLFLHVYAFVVTVIFQVDFRRRDALGHAFFDGSLGGGRCHHAARFTVHHDANLLSV